LSADDRYREARAWLDGLPNFEVFSAAQQAAERWPLERPAALLERLGRPDHRFKSILVAGTKGKGSTAAFLASVLQAHEQRVGLYSQPHLHSFSERFRIDGSIISQAEFADEIEAIRPVVEVTDAARSDLGRLTNYEVATAGALDWFARKNVEWAVLEVGLGGRLDATNVVNASVAVITPISYDHTHILGKTLPEIAAQKAGIVKHGAPAVSAPQPASALSAIRRACRAEGSPLTIVGTSAAAPKALSLRAGRFAADSRKLPEEPFFTFHLRSRLEDYGSMSIYLGGLHQVANALTALTALEASEGVGLQLDPRAVKRGLADARWPGRLEVARTAPLLVIDGAHNGASAGRLREALNLHFDFDRLHLVLGLFADKDLNAILRALRPADSLTAVEVDSPRARRAADIARAARKLGMPAVEGRDVSSSLETVLAGASRRDLVCVTGSLALVAEARETLGLATAEE
jgi:dihydrofolate synthase/folylpolyglutamate synthase